MIPEAVPIVAIEITVKLLSGNPSIVVIEQLKTGAIK
jgi:hypothetical protein